MVTPNILKTATEDNFNLIQNSYKIKKIITHKYNYNSKNFHNIKTAYLSDQNA